MNPCELILVRAIEDVRENFLPYAGTGKFFVPSTQKRTLADIPEIDVAMTWLSGYLKAFPNGGLGDAASLEHHSGSHPVCSAIALLVCSSDPGAAVSYSRLAHPRNPQCQGRQVTGCPIC